MKTSTLLILSVVCIETALCQHSEWNDFNARKPSLAINLGLIQPLLLKGANLEIDYRYGHFILGYSHGWALQFSGKAITGNDVKQNISFRVPYSTGIGAGLSHIFKKASIILDARLELKAHRFEVSYATDNGQIQHDITSYTTKTVGGGVYATYLPFGKKDNLMKGLSIATSLRYWPTVSSSLDNGEVQYFNSETNRNESHKTLNIGMANTPFIFNISVGYIFKK